MKKETMGTCSGFESLSCRQLVMGLRGVLFDSVDSVEAWQERGKREQETRAFLGSYYY